MVPIELGGCVAAGCFLLVLTHEVSIEGNHLYHLADNAIPVISLSTANTQVNGVIGRDILGCPSFVTGGEMIPGFGMFLRSVC